MFFVVVCFGAFVSELPKVWLRNSAAFDCCILMVLVTIVISRLVFVALSHLINSIIQQN